MNQTEPAFGVTLAPADPDDLVSFSVICRTKSGAGLDELRRNLSLETLEQFLPDKSVLEHVGVQLRNLGFEVFPSRRTLVSGRGSVKQFTSIFGARLLKRTRTFPRGDRNYIEIAIVLDEKSPRPSAAAIEGALAVVVMEPPTPLVPLVPPRGTKRNLRVPGDIALLTRASAVHRRQLPTGQQATGSNVIVAMIDWGFANHPYYGHHGYQVTRVSASDQDGPPDDDQMSHGTRFLACLLGCAPDVLVHAIRMGSNMNVALEDASKIPGLKVVSLSWSLEDLSYSSVLSDQCLTMRMTILDLIANGITVVAAAGNGTPKSFPAAMPEVIAVGGIEVDANDGLSVWPLSSSFTTSFFYNRWVPDVCGLAGEMMLPAAAPAPPFGWESGSGGTSGATPQVAGIAALLLQKNPSLTPAAVLSAITSTADDVEHGTTASGETATKGPDRATGSGVVNALCAWQSV